MQGFPFFERTACRRLAGRQARGVVGSLVGVRYGFEAPSRQVRSPTSARPLAASAVPLLLLLATFGQVAPVSAGTGCQAATWDSFTTCAMDCVEDDILKVTVEGVDSGHVGGVSCADWAAACGGPDFCVAESGRVAWAASGQCEARRDSVAGYVRAVCQAAYAPASNHVDLLDAIRRMEITLVDGSASAQACRGPDEGRLACVPLVPVCDAGLLACRVGGARP